MWFYYYTISFYEDSEEISTDGLTVGSNLSDVAERLAQYYGDIIELSIKPLDAEDCIEFERTDGATTILNIKRKDI